MKRGAIPPADSFHQWKKHQIDKEGITVSEAIDQTRKLITVSIGKRLKWSNTPLGQLTTSTDEIKRSLLKEFVALGYILKMSVGVANLLVIPEFMLNWKDLWKATFKDWFILEAPKPKTQEPARFYSVEEEAGEYEDDL